MTSPKPSASVVIAINPHDNDLSCILRAYADQTPVPGGFEVVVVDNGSRDDVDVTCRAFRDVRGWSRLQLARSDRPGRAAANNAGARAAQADLLIFVADDFIPTPTLVRAHWDFHAHLGGPAVGIGPAFFTGEARNDAFRRWLEDSGRLFGVDFRTAALQWPKDFFYMGNASVSRDVLARVGDFDERFLHDALDDLEFGMRLREAGIRTHFLCKAQAWHDHRLTLEERIEAMRRAGEAAARLEHRSPGRWPWAALASQPLANLAAAASESQRSPDASRRFGDALDLAFAVGYRDAHGKAVPA